MSFNYFFAQIHDWGWRLSLGGAVVPALIISIGSLVLPDTPNSLIERGKNEEAIEKLRKVRGIDDVDDEFNDLVAASEASKKMAHPWRNLLQRKYMPQLTMAITIPFFQQLTGINVIMFYAPVLSRQLGFRTMLPLCLLSSPALSMSWLLWFPSMVSMFGVTGPSSLRVVFRCSSVRYIICTALLLVLFLHLNFVRLANTHAINLGRYIYI